MEVTRTEHRTRCETCDGFGSLTVNNTNPFGYGPDPQCDEDCQCPDCLGDGEVVVWTDPLVLLDRSRHVSWAPAYRRARARAMQPARLPALQVAA